MMTNEKCGAEEPHPASRMYAATCVKPKQPLTACEHAEVRRVLGAAPDESTLDAARAAVVALTRLPGAPPMMRNEYTGRVQSMMREPTNGCIVAGLWVDREGAWESLTVTLAGHMGGPDGMPQKLASAFERRRVRLVLEVYADDIERAKADPQEAPPVCRPCTGVE